MDTSYLLCERTYTVGTNIMFPCEVCSSRTSPEVRTKLRRSSFEVGRRSYEVEAKFVRSCGVVHTKLERFRSVDRLAPMLLWCERVMHLCRFGSGELIDLSQVLWLRTVSTNGSEVRAKLARSSCEVLQRSSLRNVNIIFAPTVCSVRSYIDWTIAATTLHCFIPKATAILLSAGCNSNECVHFVQRKCSI